MGKNIYVGNLPYEMTEDELHELFSKEGQVTKAQLIRDRQTGQSKGFGFVEMSSDQEAQAAIQKLNGQNLNGRQITVNEARPRPAAGSFGGGRGGFGGRGGGGGGYGGGGRKNRW